MFTPFLAGASTGRIPLECTQEPLSSLDSVTYHQGHCIAVNAEKRSVTYKQDDEGVTQQLIWDKLVVACGSVGSTFGVAGVQENCLFLKSTSDAQAIRQHVLTQFQKASKISQDAEIEDLLRFVIVGGGPTGVELSAELVDLINGDLAKKYPSLAKLSKIHLFDSGERLLKAFSKEASLFAVQNLQNLGVQVINGLRIEKVTEEGVHLGKGELVKAGMIVWAAGIAAAPLTLQLGEQFKMDQRGFKLLTTPTFQVLNGADGKQLENIYAIGDCASIEGNDLPATAQVANQKGEHLADLLNTGKSDPFKFVNRGILAYVGGGMAIFQQDDKVKTGKLAGLIWNLVYLYLLFTWRRRWLVLKAWSGNFLCGRNLD